MLSTDASVAKEPSKPIYETGLWYLDENALTMAESHKGRAMVYPHMLVIYNEATGDEVRRIILAPDLEIKGHRSIAYIKQTNGKRMGLVNREWAFYFYDPKLSMWGLVAKGMFFTTFGKKTQLDVFKDACRQAASAGK